MQGLYFNAQVPYNQLSLIIPSLQECVIVVDLVDYRAVFTSNDGAHVLVPEAHALLSHSCHQQDMSLYLSVYSTGGLL